MTQVTSMVLKPGLRLRSMVCETEIVVVRAPKSTVDLRCGGLPMIGTNEASDASVRIEPSFASGAILGKRYADEAATLEILCVRPGEGTLALGTTPLEPKGARTLPASD